MKLKIYAGELKRALQIVEGFTSRSKTRPILTLVNVVKEGEQVYLYATDAYKGVRYHIQVVENFDLTNFCIDPYFILKLLKLYSVSDFATVTIHTVGVDNFFIDIDTFHNIPLPANVEGNYPNLNDNFKFESEQEELASFDIENLLSTLRQFKKGSCSSIKLIKGIGNRVKLLGDYNDNIEAIVIQTRNF